MENYENHRQYERKKVNLHFKVYTSVVNAGYTVEVSDISKKGAFIRHRFIPQVGETINFEIMDDNFRLIETGTAKVKWANTKTARDSWGYGVEFERELDIFQI
jgi:hypothetical protein